MRLHRNQYLLASAISIAYFEEHLISLTKDEVIELGIISLGAKKKIQVSKEEYQRINDFLLSKVDEIRKSNNQ